MTWIILALILPRSPADAVARLGSPWSIEREASSSYLLATCRRRPELLETLAPSLESPDPEVRWRFWRVARTLRPCELCKGKGLILDWWSVEYPCRYCGGRGSTWMPRIWLPPHPCRSCKGRRGTYWGDPRSLNWSECDACKGSGAAP